ncbi:MAG TPA: VOC family protein [Polyangiaceae bacterium]|nr:VOC family protein [Polyangiaceae bacterium]
MGALFQRLQAALGVRDVAASIAFYAETLGFHVRAEMGDPVDFALLGRDAVTLSLVRAARPAVADFACCYLYVSDVEAVLGDCERAGASIVQPLTRHPWGNRDFVLRDPDGHRIAIGQVEAPPEPERAVSSLRSPPRA